ncbi:unnamed protein product [Effrenium voratum]|uniref:Adenylate kinase n=1 Tax=Effrenium voratum TaxID=2562239 RepID=A0AA36JLC1_9DINO|nr:unnamed protein product [Effrenium voratum]
MACHRRRVGALLLAPLLLGFRLDAFVASNRASLSHAPSQRSGRHPPGRLQLTLCQARGGAAAGSMVVIAGPPAAGKGTQCEKIKDKYGFVHISTGDILRENVKQGTELGKKAKSYMDSGGLVPSELIVDLVKDRLMKDDVKEKGCLLDGFPRAPDQAQAMVDAGLEIQKFLVIKVPDDTLVERGCGRRLDPETGEIYHLKFRPPPEEVVDRLVHRSDDQEDKIRERLKNYHSQIDGITPFFKDVLYEVDGTGKPDAVFDIIQEDLDKM